MKGRFWVGSAYRSRIEISLQDFSPEANIRRCLEINQWTLHKFQCRFKALLTIFFLAELAKFGRAESLQVYKNVDFCLCQLRHSVAMDQVELAKYDKHKINWTKHTWHFTTIKMFWKIFFSKWNSSPEEYSA